MLGYAEQNNLNVSKKINAIPYTHTWTASSRCFNYMQYHDYIKKEHWEKPQSLQAKMGHVNIVIWSWVYFGKSLSLNSPLLFPEMQPESILQGEGYTSFLCRHTTKVSGPEFMSDRLKHWKCSVVRGVHIWAYFLGKTNFGFCVPKTKKRKGPPRLLLAREAKASICHGVGVHQCPQPEWLAGVWRYHWHRVVYWSFKETCFHQGDSFSRKVSGYFSTTKLGLILHMLQQCGLLDTEWTCLNDPSAIQKHLLLKMKGESDSSDQRLLKSWSLVSSKNG